MLIPMTRDAKWMHVAAVCAFLAAPTPNMALNAQGLESQKAIDTIIGSDVEEEEVRAADDSDRIVAAIENALAASSDVRKTSSLEKVDIVFLPDAADNGLPPPIDAALKKHEKEVADLRKELEGNAMLFHAIDSRSVLMRDVLAVEFDGQKSVVIYAAAKPSK
ncbi:hypothetical protein C7441_11666 [Pseudaminobacter salicylatoxidans]|uniref:Uncharacterized protein n=1 Tax=Pseudaminobacter salicylatoxidans TaxID=93369 RepID=A0A316BVW0_PSESE|nr:hypothetical protein [Pseudaminobacter salicylatoxidans]PWJ78399.1 hypothetical protein C7441_11666 [Pseudaminobacter salicylatoxidans]